MKRIPPRSPLLQRGEVRIPPRSPLLQRGKVRIRWLISAAVVVVAAYFLFRPAALPPGLIPEPGAYDVRILRDVWGVPHVFGRTDADVAYGLAWAHAEDDFETIQGSLLAARGRLASAYGKDAAPNDYMVQLLRVAEVVERGYPSLSPEVRALCQAYADGVNHFAALHPERAHAALYPARGEDVVAGFVHKLPLFFGVDQVLKELFEGEGGRPAAGRAVRAGFDFPDRVHGSNTFAVAPSRSAGGGTLLLINSHQPWDGPVAWYEVHLHSEEGWDMAGGVFPGAPVVLHGHNRHLGWAHTVNRPDLLDVYRLEIDPGDAGRYRFDGDWRKLETRPAPIEVKLFANLRWTFEREVLWSVYGPAVRRPHGTYALRFAGFGEVGQVEQWYRMNKARSFEEWRAAMRALALPMFNTAYADGEGNVYYVYNAKLPVRAEGYDWAGYLPGDTSQTLWTEALPYDRLPQVLNPPSGFVQNCNGTPFRTTTGPGNPRRQDFASGFGIETGLTNRGLRALELLGADTSITLAALDVYKYDTRYAQDSEMARLLERVSRLPRDQAGAAAFDVLAAWDLDASAENTRAALAILAFGRFLSITGPVEPPDDAELTAAVAEAARTLEQHFGALEVPWSEVLRLRRGDVDLGVGGGPDVLRAIYAEPAGDGRWVGFAGDSYVLTVAWDAGGKVSSRSIHQYGSATRDESSPHYADQAELFARRQMKPVWMDEAEIRANLEREYRPGEMPGG